MRRQLTDKFMTYTLGQYCSKTGQSLTDIISIGNFEIDRIATFIKLGNTSIVGKNSNYKTEEEKIEAAYEILDDYLHSDEEHSIVTAYFDLIDEFDRDIKLLKSVGVRVSDIKKQFMDQVEKNIEQSGLLNTEQKVDESEDSADNIADNIIDQTN